MAGTGGNAGEPSPSRCLRYGRPRGGAPCIARAIYADGSPELSALACFKGAIQSTPTHRHGFVLASVQRQWMRLRLIEYFDGIQLCSSVGTELN